MSRDGFDYGELSDFTSKMLTLANETMPKESKKFLKKNAAKLAKKTKNKAKKSVIEDTGNYFNSIKSGKVYKYRGQDLSCRTYSSAPHSHLIEHGHRKVTKSGKEVGFVAGFHIFEKAAKEFQNEYYADCEKFIDEMIDKGL